MDMGCSHNQKFVGLCQFELLLFHFVFSYTIDIDLKTDGGVSHDKRT